MRCTGVAASVEVCLSWAQGWACLKAHKGLQFATVSDKALSFVCLVLTGLYADFETQPLGVYSVNIY